MRYCKNELELSGVVRSIEHFHYQLYGQKFTVIIAQKFLFNVLKPNHASKRYQSRLCSWLDRLIPLTFEIELIPRKTIFFITFAFSAREAKPHWNFDEEKVVAQINSISILILNFISLDKQ